jgi:hypothetical protein
LYSAITAGLPAGTLTNEYLKAVRIQFYISFSLQSCAGSAAAGAGHRDYGSSAKVSLLPVSFDVQDVLTSV